MCLLKDLFYFLGSHGPFILFAYFIYVCLKKKKLVRGKKQNLVRSELLTVNDTWALMQGTQLLSLSKMTNRGQYNSITDWLFHVGCSLIGS